MDESGRKSLLDILPEPTVILGPDGCVTRINPAAAQLGLRPGSAVGCKLHDLVYDPPQEVQRMLAMWSSNGQFVPGALTWRTPGGPVRTRCEGAAVRDTGSTRPSLVVLRCTLSQRAATQFTVLNEQIEQLSHEVRRRRAAERELRDFNLCLEQRVAERTATIEFQSQQLRRLALAVTAAEDRERRRVADILHDHVQQMLVAAQLKIGMVLSEPMSVQAAESLQGVQGLIDQSIQASRSLSVELAPPILKDAGLIAALAWLRRQVEENYRFDLDLRISGPVPQLPADTESLLFSAVRELVFNCVKHSGERQASLVVSGEEDVLKFCVADAGRGFDPRLADRNMQASGLGLLRFRERLGFIGAAMEIDSRPGAGARVSLRLPLAGSKAEPRQVRETPGCAVAMPQALHIRGAPDRL